MTEKGRTWTWRHPNDNGNVQIIIDKSQSISFYILSESLAIVHTYLSTLSLILNFIRVVSAVYEMMGNDNSNVTKARELFSKMDENSDGLVRSVKLKTYVLFLSSLFNSQPGRVHCCLFKG